MFVVIAAGSSIPNIEQDELDTFCITPFAKCEETRRVAYVKSKMSEITDPLLLGQYQSPYEFSFEIEVVSLDGSIEDFITQDRNLVRSYVGDKCASTIMPIVRWQLPALVYAVMPPIIYRVTKMRNPPEKALAKHNLLTDDLENLGYRVLECDFDECTRAYWVMERPSAEVS